MQQVAGFTPQTYTRGPQGQGGPSLSQPATGMGRHIAQQAPTNQMKAAPLSVAGDQALPARDMHALPSASVNSLLLQGLTGPVESLWTVSRFNVDTYQRAVGLNVQRQALKDAFEDLLQAGAAEINGGVSDKMQALRDRLAQLRDDHAVVQQRLQLLSGGETSHQRSERTERPVLPEVVVSQAQSAPLESAAELPGAIQPQYSDTLASEMAAHLLQRPSDRATDLDGHPHPHTEQPVLPEVVVSQSQSAPLQFALPGEIQPQRSDTVESEVVPHLLQRPSDQMADLQSRIVVLEEPSTASTLEADVKYLEDLDQRLSVLSRECNELGQRLDQYGAEQGPRHQELEDKLTSLHQRCDELHKWSANSESRHNAEMQNLIEHHHQELEGRGAAHREEIAGLQARYQDQIGALQRELQNSHERMEKLNQSIHEDEERLQASQDKPTLTDVEANELREAVALRNKECALLTEQCKMLQLRYDALVASHQVDMDQVTSAHQSELEQLKQEHQSMIRRQDQDISDLRDVVESYKSTLSKKSDLLAINESTLADFDAQLMDATELAEKLVRTLSSVDGKHGEVQGGLAAGREQLAEIVTMAKGLMEELAEHKLAAELTSMLGECSTHFASMQKGVDDVQKELDSMRGVLSRSPAASVEPDSSAADESDVARTYASLGRREAQV